MLEFAYLVADAVGLGPTAGLDDTNIIGKAQSCDWEINPGTWHYAGLCGCE